MMQVLILLVCVVSAIGDKVKPEQTSNTFMNKCINGDIDVSAALYDKLAAHSPALATNIILETEGILTNILRKQPDVLNEQKMLRLRYILTTYLSECARINLQIGERLTAEIHNITYKHQCTYSTQNNVLFGDLIDANAYKAVVSVNQLSKPKGMLANLLETAINLIVNLLQAEDNLINGLLGQVLGLKTCIQSVIVIVDAIARSVYLTLERSLQKELGTYFGRVMCYEVDYESMGKSCVILEHCLDAIVDGFHDGHVHQVYKCMHVKYLKLQQMSLHHVMNLY